MLTKKLDNDLVTGTQGIVRAFVTRRQYSTAEAEGRLDGLVDGSPPPATTGDFLEPRYPVVLFKTSTGRARTLICAPRRFEHEYLCKGEMAKAVRRQVPLTLSWAMSIHKAQGQTLDYACVNLRGIFTEGQAYTAISRARTMGGLQITNFSRSAVLTDQSALRYTCSTPTAESLLKPAHISEWFDPPHLARMSAR